MKRIHVALPAAGARPYDILIAPGILREAPELIGSVWSGESLVVVTDSTVRKLYGSTLLERLVLRRPEAAMIDVPAGESSKSIDMFAAVHSALISIGIRRDSLVVALGGGMVGDLAGFVAATALRGISYVQVPTTVLSQVDSSVGGKTGINLRAGKNLVGSFHQPRTVLIDPEVLATLPDAEYRSGLAEVVKIAAALDASMFRFLERRARFINERDTTTMTDVIAAAVSLKAEIVRRDERESSLRKSLNLGHTVGHALETAHGYRVRHGDAVAVGLRLETRMARSMGMISRSSAERIQTLLDRLGLPRRLAGRFSRPAFLAALSADKKAAGSKPEFVLPAGIGICAIGVPVPGPILRATLRSLR